MKTLIDLVNHKFTLLLHILTTYREVVKPGTMEMETETEVLRATTALRMRATSEFPCPFPFPFPSFQVLPLPQSAVYNIYVNNVIMYKMHEVVANIHTVWK